MSYHYIKKSSQATPRKILLNKTRPKSLPIPWKINKNWNINLEVKLLLSAGNYKFLVRSSRKLEDFLGAILVLFV